MAENEQRMFFALWPESELRRSLHSLAADLPLRRSRQTHVADLHATLVFLGNVAEERVACIEQAARGVSAPAFDLLIDRVGYWPRPRILWCGASASPNALNGLVQDLQRRLEGCGFAPERRPYTAHITLARKASPVRPHALTQPLSWPVRDFVLVTSRLGGEPPRYRVVGRWSLGAP